MMPPPKLGMYNFERVPKDAYENVGILFLLKIYHFKKLLRLLTMSIFNTEVAPEQELPVESNRSRTRIGYTEELKSCSSACASARNPTGCEHNTGCRRHNLAYAANSAGPAGTPAYTIACASACASSVCTLVCAPAYVSANMGYTNAC